MPGCSRFFASSADRGLLHSGLPETFRVSQTLHCAPDAQQKTQLNTDTGNALPQHTVGHSSQTQSLQG